MSRKKAPQSATELSPEVRVLCDVLNKEPDIPCVILAAHFLDEALRTLIHSILLETLQAKELLESGQGPLGTFGARSRLAYALNLIPRKLFENLNTIRKLRNEMAHRYSGTRLSDPSMRDRCMSLHLPVPSQILRVGFAEGDSPPEPWKTDPRSRFTLVVTSMANRILLTALSQGRPKGEAPGKEWTTE